MAFSWLKCPMVSQNDRCKNLCAAKRPMNLNIAGYFDTGHFEPWSLHGNFHFRIIFDRILSKAGSLSSRRTKVWYLNTTILDLKQPFKAKVPNGNHVDYLSNR